ncbi:hypothetical protein BOM23_03180 [Erwinia sp. OLMDLW33]|nr:hypothetical protein BOM23_03180 [Erwinia sp. OLMDLW33]
MVFVPHQQVNIRFLVVLTHLFLIAKHQAPEVYLKGLQFLDQLDENWIRNLSVCHSGMVLCMD